MAHLLEVGRELSLKEEDLSESSAFVEQHWGRNEGVMTMEEFIVNKAMKSYCGFSEMDTISYCRLYLRGFMVRKEEISTIFIGVQGR